MHRKLIELQNAIVTFILRWKNIVFIGTYKIGYKGSLYIYFIKNDKYELMEDIEFNNPVSVDTMIYTYMNEGIFYFGTYGDDNYSMEFKSDKELLDASDRNIFKLTYHREIKGMINKIFYNSEYFFFIGSDVSMYRHINGKLNYTNLFPQEQFNEFVSGMESNRNNINEITIKTGFYSEPEKLLYITTHNGLVFCYDMAKFFISELIGDAVEIYRGTDNIYYLVISQHGYRKNYMHKTKLLYYRYNNYWELIDEIKYDLNRNNEYPYPNVLHATNGNNVIGIVSPISYDEYATFTNGSIKIRKIELNNKSRECPYIFKINGIYYRYYCVYDNKNTKIYLLNI